MFVANDGKATLLYHACVCVLQAVLDSVFSHLFAARVVLEGMILKPNMVVPGKKCAEQASPERIAEATLRIANPFVQDR